MYLADLSGRAPPSRRRRAGVAAGLVLWLAARATGAASVLPVESLAPVFGCPLVAGVAGGEGGR